MKKLAILFVSIFLCVCGSGSNGNAGGLAGYTSSTISNSLAVIQGRIDATNAAYKGNIRGAGTGSGSNNYRYKDNVAAGTNNKNDKNGAAVTAEDLKTTAWWTNTLGFSTSKWILDDVATNMPLPKALEGKVNRTAWPSWTMPK